MKRRTQEKNVHQMHRAGKRITGWMFVVTGLLLFFYPNWNQQCREYSVRRKLKVAYQQTEQMDNREMLEKMQAYNRKIYEEKQRRLDDEETLEKMPELDGIEPFELFGTIEIPAIKCSLPLYLGASPQHLDQGAAVLGETSLPVGGNSTNSVIAAHRGWRQNSYFKYIDALVEGDLVYVTNFQEELKYEVTEIKIIDPDAIEEIRIQSGKDLLTLITCHPYRSGGKYRYMVVCRRLLSDEQNVTEMENGNLNGKCLPENMKLQDRDSEISEEIRFRRVGIVLLTGMVEIMTVRGLIKKSGKRFISERRRGKCGKKHFI